MKKLSIGLRLTLWYVAIFAVAQAAFGAGMWFILRTHMYDLVDDNLEEQVADVKHFLQVQEEGVPLATLKRELAEEYDLERPGNYVQIYLQNGEWLYRSAFLQENRLAPVQPDAMNRPKVENRRFGERNLRFMSEKLEVNGLVFVAQAGVGINDVLKTLNLFRSYLLMFAPLVLLVAAGVGYWLSQRALAPVDAIVQTAREIGGTNLQRRLTKLHTGDELQRLSDTLNEMLDRIEQAFQRISQFTADASHELRTPVALMRTEAELALRRSRGEAEYNEALRHILLEAERTTALIEELLAMARADAGRETLNMGPVDLRSTVRELAADWRQVANIRNLHFEENIPETNSFVLGDQSALRRVVNIMLDNAFKYTNPPGTVLLALIHEENQAVVTVRDTGVGIAAEEQGKIFERFYRVDKARSRALGGAGLGLAIAEWIVQQHRGTIEVESVPGQGSVFRVKLPLAASSVQNALPARSL